jgi:murein DD-endopeptidase MepM/ murein hydrolase activator NlpD
MNSCAGFGPWIGAFLLISGCNKGGDILTEETKNSEKQPKKLMINSQQKQAERTICIPIIAVKGAALLLCLLIVVMVGFFWHYSQVTQSAASAATTELESSHQDNDVQAKQIEHLANTTASLQADLERLNALDAEIRHIINNEATTTPSRAGVLRPSGIHQGQGGPLVPPDLNEINQVTNDLQSQIILREQSLAELKQEVLVRQAKLAATPSMWPAAGDVTSRFGWRNSPWGAGSDFHPGIDIANNMGTPIFATADGVVVRASDGSDGYGNLVQIDHGNGIATLYGHNSQIIVSVGQTVKKGQIVSYLGSTGNSTGPHVHYEVRVNGNAVNPETFLML